MAEQLIVRRLGLRNYLDTAEAMRAFTEARSADTTDELWLLQHPPVFTQGQAGRAEHVLDPGPIPVIASSRGGQVTYHGPGQMVAYPLLDLRRRGLGIRPLVSLLERTLVDMLAGYGVTAFPRADAPGVYVCADFGEGVEEVRKIASVGLRVSRGCSYHGIALNVDMDLSPFLRINPCGHAGLRMTQLRDLGVPADVDDAGERFQAGLQRQLATATPVVS